ncbi:MAG: hypothetical protein KAU60_12205 [Desulfobacterales bacterium]|nr:hypothetical protein [Desulfobacterales bacterium]
MKDQMLRSSISIPSNIVA